MTLARTWSWSLSSLLCGMVLVAGCASQTKQQWLTFFFDGVPGAPLAPHATPPELSRVEHTFLPPVWALPPRLGPLTAALAPGAYPPVVHPPYAERRCIECHASNYSQRLKGDVSAICTTCHKAFLVPAKYGHAPVADGQCTLCHEPHQAKEKFLLVKNSRELCFDCHEPEPLFQKQACEQSKGRACTECHDPHQANRKFLLFTHAGSIAPVQNQTPKQ